MTIDNNIEPLDLKAMVSTCTDHVMRATLPSNLASYIKGDFPAISSYFESTLYGVTMGLKKNHMILSEIRRFVFDTIITELYGVVKLDKVLAYIDDMNTLSNDFERKLEVYTEDFISESYFVTLNNKLNHPKDIFLNSRLTAQIYFNMFDKKGFLKFREQMWEGAEHLFRQATWNIPEHVHLQSAAYFIDAFLTTNPEVDDAIKAVKLSYDRKSLELAQGWYVGNDSNL